jgi:hypothetical protein
MFDSSPNTTQETAQHGLWECDEDVARSRQGTCPTNTAQALDKSSKKLGLLDDFQMTTTNKACACEAQV